MRKRRYDLVFGLGTACSCSETLRRAGLQLLSFPYDWITIATENPSDYVGDVVARAREIANGFSGWLAKEDLCLAKTGHSAEKDVYNDIRRNLVFNHDFPAGSSLDAVLPSVRVKYERRINRLLALLAESKRVLVVRLDRPDLPVRTEKDEALASLEVLSRAYPKATFDFLQLSYEEGRPIEEMTVETAGDHYTRWTFDYKDHRPEVESHRVMVPTLGEFLAARYAVRDYRSREEKRAYDNARRKARYARVGATTVLGYHLARCGIKLKRLYALIRK